MTDVIRIYHSNACLQHDTGNQHPENAFRLRAIQEALQSSTFAHKLAWVEARPGTNEQILLAHSPLHLEHVHNSRPERGRIALDADTIMSPGSWDAALRGVGAACAGIDALMHNEAAHVFCLTRPPGHHATRDRAMGFCIFNNIAIAARYALSEYGVERIAIVDFDVHHGNGTQDIVKGLEGVFYMSTHQSPHYPGTGEKHEKITNNILNIPLGSGVDDETYREIFQQEILTELRAYKPQLVLVSAGFDAHKQDPLATLGLTDATYFWLGQQLRNVAILHAQGRILSVLEGGYNLKVLGGSARAWLQGTLPEDYCYD